MAKPTKPSWAFGDPSYIIEPSGGKKTVGWLAGEKPPFQYMNWIHVQTKSWLDYLENKVERIAPTLLRSAASVTWNNGVLTFGSPIQVSFRYLTGEQINQFPAGSFTLSNGQVVVLKKDKSNPSPVSITNGTYGNLGAAQYAIVNESSLTAADEENETVIFRRNGTNLEIPILGQIVANGKTFQLGALSATVTAAEVTVADAGNFYTGTNVEAVLQEIGPTINTVDNFTYTGTGAIVRQNSPTIFTPTLTTPTIGNFTLANHGHLNAASGGTLSGNAIASNITGSGNVVKDTSPTITTPTIFTPTIANFTNSQHNHLSAAGGGVLDAAAIASGTFANARISVGNVTQHQASLSILESQITDGTILARVASNETITGSWQFSSLADPPPTDGSVRRQSFSKGWAKINGATGALLSSYNIATSSKIGTGHYSLTPDNPFNSSNEWVILATSSTVGVNNDVFVSHSIVGAAAEFFVQTSANIDIDAAVSVGFLGNLG